MNNDCITLPRFGGFFYTCRIFRSGNYDARHVPLYQYEYDALVSVLFNTGPGHRLNDPWPGTRSQYLADFLNHGEYDRMGDVIRGFIANIVAGRRRREARLFETGVYDATH
jgi:lysozyme